MIKLYSLDKHSYQVESKAFNISVRGNYRTAMEVMHHIGVSHLELSYALDEMLKNNHEVAEFGVHKRFVFTSKLMN